MTIMTTNMITSMPILLLLVWGMITRRVECDIAFGSDGADELTLAIVNITNMEPFTGFASNFRDDMGAKFTTFGSAKIGTISGLLVKVLSGEKRANDACEPIDPSQWASEPWILVAQHGSCKDEQKMKNIIRTNASAALIYDNKPNPRLVKLKFTNMISVFITKSKGEEMLHLMENGTRMSAQLTVGPHSTFRYANINRTSVLFVSVSFIILMIISLAWLIFYYIQRFRYIQAKDILARRLCTAAKKALEKIPTKTLRSADLQSNPTTAPHGDYLECCAVCIETFKPADLVRILPCKHVFHKACVDPWLLDQRSCPMCKLDILKFFGLTIFTGSQESIFSEDFERGAHSRRDRRVHGSDDVEVIHIPNPGHGSRDSRAPAGGSLPPSSRTASSTMATACPMTTSGFQPADASLINGVTPSDLPADVIPSGQSPHAAAASATQMQSSSNPKVNVSVSIETVSSDTIDESKDARVVSTSSKVPPDVVKSASKKASKT